MGVRRVLTKDAGEMGESNNGKASSYCARQMHYHKDQGKEKPYHSKQWRCWEAL
jgi:hypothetical protein